jgi:hypothetical protein
VNRLDGKVIEVEAVELPLPVTLMTPDEKASGKVLLLCCKVVALTVPPEMVPLFVVVPAKVLPVKVVSSIVEVTVPVSAKVTAVPVTEVLAIEVKVLDEPLIVLFVKVCVSLVPTTLDPIAKP